MRPKCLSPEPELGSIGASDGLASLRDPWVVHALDEVDSTSTFASKLPAWNAVRSNTQTAGRGRTGRQWVSDRGGLWISAVLPCELREPFWQFLPLAVGWSLASALSDLGVRHLRVRWPNDLMVGRKKLGGILAERFHTHTAVVGIGMNVFNTPEHGHSELTGATARLVELLPRKLSLDELVPIVLAAFRRAHGTLRDHGFMTIASDLNERWTEPRLVELTLAGQERTVTGRFAGISQTGALRLLTQPSVIRTFAATQVALLRELDQTSHD